VAFSLEVLRQDGCCQCSRSCTGGPQLALDFHFRPQFPRKRCLDRGLNNSWVSLCGQGGSMPALLKPGTASHRDRHMGGHSFSWVIFLPSHSAGWCPGGTRGSSLSREQAASGSGPHQGLGWSPRDTHTEDMGPLKGPHKGGALRAHTSHESCGCLVQSTTML
jgi:hypothetical protein